MKKMIIIGLLSSGLFATTSLKERVQSLNDVQTERIKVAYSVGKNIKASDGTNFAMTLPSIAGVESSWGSLIIGDSVDKKGNKKHLFECSLGAFQIKMDTARLTIRNNPVLFEKYGNLIYEGERVSNNELISAIANIKKYSNILTDKELISKKNQGDKKSINKLIWAKTQLDLSKDNYVIIAKKYSTDSKLANKLLNDYEFSSVIAGNYLKDMYNIAHNRNYNNKFKRAIGRYNGGWHNMDYANAVVDNLDVVHAVKYSSY